ncbi:MAG: capsule biosynthesis protein [Rhodobacteraceae bacterium]|nr:capsule biosynthesis protein [Paracoccaceae bacterium]
MTMKPKAKKFRIRRNESAGSGSETSAAPAPANTAAAQAAAQPSTAAQAAAKPSTAAKAAAKPSTAAQGNSAAAPKGKPKGKADASAEDGFGRIPFPGAAAADAANEKDPAKIASDLDAIRKEGLTGRQLRLARRLAQKHGLAPTSDFDAVRLLRANGIDPFQRANMLELVVADKKAQAPTPNLPQTVDRAKTELSTNVTPPGGVTAEARAQEILRIQQDIARRRRVKLIALAGRLAVFVLLPTSIALVYFAFFATPMYATKSEFVIQQADAPAAGGMGGLLSGTGFATSQDSITVQSYLQSRQAVLRLDEDLGFRNHFSSDRIDAVQRLDPDASNEDTYKLFQRNVKIGYDPTEGIIKLEVVAASPEASAAFSEALIGYAEEQVDNLTQRLREDQMSGASETFVQAEANMMGAQMRVLELQEQLGVLDPVSESTALMGQISNFEVQLAQKQLELQQLLDNAQPSRARVSGVEGDISRLETLIQNLRGQLTNGNDEGGSLASISSQLRVAEVDLQTRTLMMQEALQSLEASRIEANRQVRYLSLGVNPVPPDEPTYPRVFENTMLTFLIFAGVYLVVSLTTSILREQVSN